jgi:hypothetical protein
MEYKEILSEDCLALMSVDNVPVYAINLSCLAGVGSGVGVGWGAGSGPGFGPGSPSTYLAFCVRTLIEILKEPAILDSPFPL